MCAGCFFVLVLCYIAVARLKCLQTLCSAVPFVIEEKLHLYINFMKFRLAIV